MIEFIATMVIVMAAAALATPPVILGVLFVYMIIGEVAEKIAVMLSPPPAPSCNIDPRCHPAFVLDREGTGWIGETRING